MIAAHCLVCNELLISKHVHDFVKCACINESFIDGGQHDYVRFGGHDISKVVTGTWTPDKDPKPAKKRVRK